MTELPTQLRERALRISRGMGMPRTVALLRRAADEIERLEKEVSNVSGTAGVAGGVFKMEARKEDRP